MTTKHTARCEQNRLRRETFEKQFPRYCRKCDASGRLAVSENQSPLGSRQRWMMESCEACPECVDQGKCPRCGRLQYTLKQRLTLRINRFLAWVYRLFYRIPLYHGSIVGLAIQPWTRYNWLPKAALLAARAVNKLELAVDELLDPVEEDLFAEQDYCCRFCGWQHGEEAPVYECWCEMEKLYATLDIS